MIKNERQYQITKRQLGGFVDALAEVRQRTFPDDSDDQLFQQIDRDALESQIHDLRREIMEYEALKRGGPATLAVESFEGLPHALIAARIAVGLTQRELAERLGIQEQQIQRYEATDYAAASLQRVGEVIRALGLVVREEITLPTTNAS